MVFHLSVFMAFEWNTSRLGRYSGFKTVSESGRIIAGSFEDTQTYSKFLESGKNINLTYIYMYMHTHKKKDHSWILIEGECAEISWLKLKWLFLQIYTIVSNLHPMGPQGWGQSLDHTFPCFQISIPCPACYAALSQHQIMWCLISISLTLSSIHGWCALFCYTVWKTQTTFT